MESVWLKHVISIRQFTQRSMGSRDATSPGGVCAKRLDLRIRCADRFLEKGDQHRIAIPSIQNRIQAIGQIGRIERISSDGKRGLVKYELFEVVGAERGFHRT